MDIFQEEALARFRQVPGDGCLQIVTYIEIGISMGQWIEGIRRSIVQGVCPRIGGERLDSGGDRPLELYLQRLIIRGHTIRKEGNIAETGIKLANVFPLFL